MIKKYLLVVMLGFGLALPVLSHAQSAGKFEKGLYALKKDTLPYQILMPENFDPQKKYPLVIVLHGAGERGNDNQAQMKYGTGLFLNAASREKYPAIVIYPQCPANDFWSNVKIKIDSANKRAIFNFVEGGEPTKAMHALMGLVDNFLDKPYINKHQVYIGGLSMGGMGTFEILRREPKVFAAAFAICGGDNTNNAKIYAKKIPLWIFHGGKDDTVPVDHSKVMVAAIKAAGGDPKFTLYPNDGHNSWDDAFAEPELLPWLFEHVK
jgi:predicted peptidase